jgi:hypothetical protein
VLCALQSTAEDPQPQQDGGLVDPYSSETGRPRGSTGSWGLGVIEADDEEQLKSFAQGDPVVTTGTATIELGKMLAGFVRPR